MEASPTNVAIIKIVCSISVDTASLGRTIKRRMKRRARKASNWQFPKSLNVFVRVKLALLATRSVVALLTGEVVTKTA